MRLLLLLIGAYFDRHTRKGQSPCYAYPQSFAGLGRIIAFLGVIGALRILHTTEHCYGFAPYPDPARLAQLAISAARV
ncbi:hypothetical protein Z948_637 [Sulfitobacter donghicola DSW-25 = KCTC 12864 = JCM 14565]|nr:hypothetical protein Z948_637 [Sulfitobacter donghicola DSW-25 = KCTC 12864 = JCM 14565]